MPETIRVKLSTEQAASVSITPVVARELPLRELVELMLDTTGKNPGPIQALLLRGTLVSGATRYRWTSLDASKESVEELLASFPEPEPYRPFSPTQCAQVRLRGPSFRTTVPSEALRRKRLFRRRSFWDVLIDLAVRTEVRYVGFSYRDRADRYEIRIQPSQQEVLKQGANLLRYSTLETQIRAGVLESVEFLVLRGSERA